MADAGAWRRWSTPGPRLDRALAAAVLTADLVGMVVAHTDTSVSSPPLGVGAVACAVGSAAVLLARRTRPIGALLASGAAAAVTVEVATAGLLTQQTGITIILGCYAIGAWSNRRVASIVVPVAVLALMVFGARDDGSDRVEAVTVGLAAAALPWMAGRASRSQRQYVAEVEDRLAAAEAAQDERARRAVLDERTHIARELHDVVAHHVSLIGVQAGAARTSLDHAPEVTRTALVAIEQASRAAVGEMQALLGALRADGGGQPLAPLPGLAQLDELLAGFRAAGLEVGLSTPTPLPALAPALELTVYRIVEEALTNVTRHSAALTATVAVAVDPQGVHVRVADPGPARPAPTAAGGRGLVGVTERVALFGGDARVGPTPDGGFEVAVTLPRAAP